MQYGAKNGDILYEKALGHCTKKLNQVMKLYAGTIYNHSVIEALISNSIFRSKLCLQNPKPMHSKYVSFHLLAKE